MKSDKYLYNDLPDFEIFLAAVNNPSVTRDQGPRRCWEPGTVSCVLSNGKDIFGWANLTSTLELINIYILTQQTCWCTCCYQRCYFDEK